MNTFWIKTAAVVIVVFGIVILVNVFYTSKSEPKSEPQPEPKSFYDVIAEDDKMFRPAIEDERSREPTRPRRQPEHMSESAKRPSALSPEERVQVERLFEMALFERKKARLPGMTYKRMVDYCRQIIEQYPESKYAAKAKMMLRVVPQRYRKQYNITNEEIGL